MSSAWSTRPASSTSSSRPSSRMRSPGRLEVGAVAEDHAAQAGDALAGGGDRGRDLRHALLRDVTPGGDHQRRLGLGRRLVTGAGLGPGIAGVLAGQPHDRGAVAVLAQALLREPREGEAPVGKAQAEALHGEADPPGDGAQVGAPVVASPDLVPVDDQRRGRAREPERQPGPDHLEVRKRGGVDGVVAAAVAEQVPEDAEAEAKRRPDAPPPGARVELARRGDGQRLEGRPRPLLPPLPAGQVGDRMALAQPLGEIAVPALGTSDRVREEAVVDDRDLHRARRYPASPPAAARSHRGQRIHGARD